MSRPLAAAAALLSLILFTACSDPGGGSVASLDAATDQVDSGGGDDAAHVGDGDAKPAPGADSDSDSDSDADATPPDLPFGDADTVTAELPPTDTWPPDTGPDTVKIDPTTGKTIGEPCVTDRAGYNDCRFGLDCVGGTCQAPGDLQEGWPCVTTAECGPGLYCALEGSCAPAGDSAEGDLCATAADCLTGLYCRSLGLVGTCAAAGSGDVRAPCGDLADCMAGLRCDEDGLCAASSLLFGHRPWRGADCPLADQGERPEVLFELPRGEVGVGGDPPYDPRQEFFRLPFPNDIRQKAGGVDLSGFPTPGPGVIGVDVVARLVEAVGWQQHGFSTIPTVYFRFGAALSVDSLKTSGDTATLLFRDIDSDSPRYDQGNSYSWFITDGRGRYICRRWLAVRTDPRRPLWPSTTYAVILLEGLKDTGGHAMERSSDFPLMMQETAPADGVALAAWQAYAPLRAYLDTEDISRDSVLGAAVFTTGDAPATLQAIRDAVRAQPAGEAHGLTLCDGATTSPCDDGLAGDDHIRGCFGVSDAMHEIHLTLGLPIVQTGARPYLSPDDGGAVATEAGGAVQVMGTEHVCASLTVPKGTAMPAAGWPVLVYGHDAGATFRTAADTIGERLAAIPLEAGVAVLSWDAPLHGARRGGSTLPPEALLGNLTNPRGLRGSLLQGAADVFAIVQTLESLVIPAAESPTGAEIRFDADHLILGGSGLGAHIGALAAPHEPSVRLTVWGGAGGGIASMLLGREKPADGQAAFALALMELSDQGPITLKDDHPVLALLQGLLDPVEPISHARGQIRAVPDAGAPQHVLLVQGMGDAFVPAKATESLARTLGLDHVEPVLESYGMTEVSPPISGNLEGGAVTGALIQAAPPLADPHLALESDPTTLDRAAHSIRTWLSAGLPEVPAP